MRFVMNTVMYTVVEEKEYFIRHFYLCIMCVLYLVTKYLCCEKV